MVRVQRQESGLPTAAKVPEDQSLPLLILHHEGGSHVQVSRQVVRDPRLEALYVPAEDIHLAK